MTGDNNNSLEKSQKSCLTKHDEETLLALVKAYPGLDGQASPYIYCAVEEQGNSLVELDKKLGSGASELWIRYQLIKLFTFLGTIETITSYQTRELAKRIRTVYYHMTLPELSCFFYSFSLGEYGKLYGGRSVNPQDVLIALNQYQYSLNEMRIKYDSDKRLDEEIQNKKKWNEEGITYEQWRAKQKGETNIDKLKKKFKPNRL